jgi:hypothetical protein
MSIPRVGPHTAVREDPTMNLPQSRSWKDGPWLCAGHHRGWGDNLTLTFSPALDYFLYVIDVAAGDKIPRKNGPGVTHSDLLVINKPTWRLAWEPTLRWCGATRRRCGRTDRRSSPTAGPARGCSR